MKKSHLNKKYSSYIESTNSTRQKVHVGSQYSKTYLKQSLKKDKTKILITNGSLMKVESIAECSLWSILQYLWPALSINWSSFFSGRLRQVLLYNRQSIYLYAYKCLCQCVGKVITQMSTVVSLMCLGPSFQKRTHHFLLHESLWPINLEKTLKPCSLAKSLFTDVGKSCSSSQFLGSSGCNNKVLSQIEWVFSWI